jgi:uncharacterized protein YdaU (DUF1376 family)
MMILVKRGTPGKAGEVKTTFFWWDISREVPSKELFQAVLLEDMKITEVKELVSAKLKTLKEPMNIPANCIRLRELTSDKSAGKVCDEKLTLKEYRSWNLEFAQLTVQCAEQPNEVFTKDTLIIPVQRWFSSTWTLSPKSEMVISGLTPVTEFGSLLSTRFDVPVKTIMFCKPVIFGNVDITDLPTCSWYKPDEKTVQGKVIKDLPLNIDSGMLILVRDGAEVVKKLTEAEKRALKGDGDSFWPSFGSSSKESGLKIGVVTKKQEQEAKEAKEKAEKEKLAKKEAKQAENSAGNASQSPQSNSPSQQNSQQVAFKSDTQEKGPATPVQPAENGRVS